MQNPVYITGIASVSALGMDNKETLNSYLSGSGKFSDIISGKAKIPAAPVSEKIEKELKDLRESDSNYKHLDKSVLLAILASRILVKETGWEDKSFGINIGSSRGATFLFEKYHEEFIRTGRVSTLTSPTTTLGNISSWVAQDLESEGVHISHSITCSTALHSFLNGMAWMASGMAEKFIVGGSEAPLTPFTFAQMQALKLYSKKALPLACESMNFEKKQNTMVLGEAAAVASLEKKPEKNPLAVISGFGFSSEKLQHSISLTEDAECFQRSMAMALKNAGFDTVDSIIMHAPGTIKGDRSELKAVHSVFKVKVPALTSNKWIIGHTFGASGIMSMEMGILMLQHQKFIKNPFYTDQNAPDSLNSVMINAVGFGGNAVSIIISKP